MYVLKFFLGCIKSNEKRSNTILFYLRNLAQYLDKFSSTELVLSNFLYEF